MGKIEPLSSDQGRLLVQRAKEWAHTVSRTQVTDRDRATAAVRQLYRAAKLDDPDILWFRSPGEGVAAVGALKCVNWIDYHEDGFKPFDELTIKLGHDVRHQTPPGLETYVQQGWWSVREGGQLVHFDRLVHAEVGALAHSLNYDRERYDVAHRVLPAIPEKMRRRFWALWRPLQYRMWRDPVFTPFKGTREAFALGRWQFFAEIGVEFSEAGELEARMEIARSAGWWWPYRNVCVITDRPIMLKFNDRGLVHSTTGPAVRYADGFSIAVQHGMRVADTHWAAV